MLALSAPASASFYSLHCGLLETTASRKRQRLARLSRRVVHAIEYNILLPDYINAMMIVRFSLVICGSRKRACCVHDMVGNHSLKARGTRFGAISDKAYILHSHFLMYTKHQFQIHGSMELACGSWRRNISRRNHDTKLIQTYQLKGDICDANLVGAESFPKPNHSIYIPVKITEARMRACLY